VSIFKGSLLARLAPKDLVAVIGIERRIDGIAQATRGFKTDSPWANPFGCSCSSPSSLMALMWSLSDRTLWIMGRTKDRPPLPVSAAGDAAADAGVGLNW